MTLFKFLKQNLITQIFRGKQWIDKMIRFKPISDNRFINSKA